MIFCTFLYHDFSSAQLSLQLQSLRVPLMARPSRGRGRRDRKLCSSPRQAVEDNKPLHGVQTLSRRCGTRQPLGHGANVRLQLISNRRGTRRSHSPSPNRSRQCRRQSYSEWHAAGNGELEISPIGKLFLEKWLHLKTISFGVTSKIYNGGLFTIR
jgi:hypothetical protein